jgi:Ca-activated chloride channel family protein
MLEHIHFADPEYLYLLLAIPFAGVWYWFRSGKIYPEMRMPVSEAYAGVRPSLKLRLRPLLIIVRLLCISAIIIALARPQSNISRQDISVEGIDIVLATDISGSMLAEDFKPNRLEASKDVATSFIRERPNDRIGLVVFSGESFTQCPLTTDHAVLINLYNDIQSGMIDDGTALGDGLATAVSRLKESKTVSKVIILLTDGVNNMGALDPLSAAEIAQLYGIRIYTIGVGTIGTAPYPFQTPFGIQYQNIEVKIDEPLLRKISQLTNGKYFRATNKSSLSNIYNEIDKLEKSKIDVTEFKRKKEEFFPLIFIAVILLCAEIILRQTYFRSNP